MSRAKLLLSLAVLGIAMAVVAVLYDSRPAPAQHLPIVPPQAPYADYVAAAGLVEASSGNIAIATPVSGVISAIDVKVGGQGKAGDALDEVDAQDLRSQHDVARARVQDAAAALWKPKHRLDNAEHLHKRDPNLISVQDLSDLRDDYAQAKAAYALASAELERLQADIARRTVRAPVGGRILQMKMRRGEYLEAANAGVPALVLGNDAPLYVRVDVDENEAWRVRPDAKATAFVRGVPALSVPLTFAYIEPYVIPKTALTGLSTERTDRRVLQVLYSFTPGEIPIYVGQQLDVYIQAEPRSPAQDGTGN